MSDFDSIQEQVDRWETAVAEFRQHCRTAAVGMEEIRNLAGQFPPSQKSDILANLISAHLEETWLKGNGQLLEDYLEGLTGFDPDYASVQRIPADVVLTEFAARHLSGPHSDHPTIDSYRSRFPEREDIQRSLAEQLFGERYVRLRRLGQGGLGRVWLSYDYHLGRFVALKEPNPGACRGNGIATLLSNEARITAELEHPAIVPIYELEESDSDLPYYVMRVVQGRTLRNLCQEFHGKSSNRSASQRRILQTQLLRAFITVCEAVAYAHSRDVLHRDLKPDNIVVGEFGETMLLDWGLAQQSAAPLDAASRVVPIPTGDTPVWYSTLRSTSIQGTLAYMSQEASEGNPEKASDIFGLGAVLYEILTGRPPYEPVANESPEDLLQRVRSSRFPRPGKVRRIPRSLEAICLKATASEASDRYADATLLAGDIQCWLADEPVSAVPNRPHRRIARFVRRHLGGTVAVSLALILFISAGFASAWLATETNRRLFESERNRFQVAVGDTTKMGWRKNGWEIAKGIQAIRDDPTLLDIHIPKLLSGIDARKGIDLKGHARSISYDRTGKRLVAHRVIEKESMICIFTEKREQRFRAPRATILDVAFLKDRAVALIQDVDSRDISLWDVSAEQIRSRLPTSAAKPIKGGVEAATFSADAEFAAVSTKERLLVFDVKASTFVAEFPGSATALAFSPDGTILVAGRKTGEMDVFSVADKKRLVRMAGNGSLIHSLAVARDPVRALEAIPDDPLDDWILASSDSGAAITIWDLKTQYPRVFCIGSKYSVSALSFSPDSSLLASSGRGTPVLWDVATGKKVVALTAGNTSFSVELSPTGESVAATFVDSHHAGHSYTWDLDRGVGIRTLLGLRDPIEKLYLSTNNRYLAALTHGWRIGIWDAQSGHLLHVLASPPGDFVDNSNLVISESRGEVLFATDEAAALWDLKSGKMKAKWQLYPGLQNSPVFTADGRMLLSRYETVAGEPGPYSDAHPQTYPRIVRLRQLQQDGQTSIVGEFDVINWHIHAGSISADGSIVVVQGRHLRADNRVLVAIDVKTKREIWRSKVDSPAGSASIMFDPSGKRLVAYHGIHPRHVHDVASGAIVDHIDDHLHAFSADMKYLIFTNSQGLGIRRSATGPPILVFGKGNTAGAPVISRNGEVIAWREGSHVFLGNVAEILAKLKAHGFER